MRLLFATALFAIIASLISFSLAVPFGGSSKIALMSTRFNDKLARLMMQLNVFDMRLVTFSLGLNSQVSEKIKQLDEATSRGYQHNADYDQIIKEAAIVKRTNTAATLVDATKTYIKSVVHSLESFYHKKKSEKLIRKDDYQTLKKEVRSLQSLIERFDAVVQSSINDGSPINHFNNLLSELATLISKVSDSAKTLQRLLPGYMPLSYHQFTLGKYRDLMQNEFSSPDLSTNDHELLIALTNVLSM